MKRVLTEEQLARKRENTRRTSVAYEKRRKAKRQEERENTIQNRNWLTRPL